MVAFNFNLCVDFNWCMVVLIKIKVKLEFVFSIIVWILIEVFREIRSKYKVISKIVHCI